MGFHIHYYNPTKYFSNFAMNPSLVWYTYRTNDTQMLACLAENYEEAKQLPNPLVVFHISGKALQDKIDCEKYHEQNDKCLFHCMISSLAKLQL